ncbi:prolyl-tRNA synthetase [Jimgerdemannia flammicorona]|uniref:proline--tRNA ligase n=1 Tax=Jimgerdemannia flammicorona TaxID=994334 RepID=A0A433B9R4_9FUNG|nr:prolyl-tRNA synthetase [Jimgerdemannia flammicorona]
MFIPTTKDSLLGPNAVASHRLMLRAGFIRQSASGVYSLLPLGLRTLDKLETIIEEEMRFIVDRVYELLGKQRVLIYDASFCDLDAQKLSLPALLSAEPWKQTGRWESSGGELFRLKDRKSADFLLAPTHEEEITQLVAGEVTSYRQLPLRLYQIGRKYRDEMRPRSGLLRGREFLMKDLYTFDATEEEATATYEDVRAAYAKVFRRIGVPFVVADADTGNIGGTSSHEYHFISEVGEDSLLICPECGYTANEERARGIIPHHHHAPSISNPFDTFASSLLPSLSLPPSALTIQLASAELVIKNAKEAETSSERDVVAIVIESGRTVNMLKLRDAVKKQLGEKAKDGINMDLLMGIQTLETMRKQEERWSKLSVYVDDSVNSIIPDPTSAPPLPQSIESHPLAVFAVHTDTTLHHGDFHNVQPGDTCPQCPAPLTLHRAIEVGHTFLLGTKYSAALGATFRPAGPVAGGVLPIQMGCFGLGVSRMLAAIVESSNDTRGIAWPVSVAPFRVAVVPVDVKNEGMKAVAERVYDALDGMGGSLRDEVVMDDRQGASFGFRMKDAELVGYPYIVVVGKRAAEGVVEIQERRKGEKNRSWEIGVGEVGGEVGGLVAKWLSERH